ncbi:MAG TPA: globin domain-containing protein [Chitinophagaceae bacterium]|nr:globin domain-containing protein [Chitinophagaceae bacterium]
MTEAEIRLVKQSWKTLRAIDPVIVGDLFYSKLFMANPSLRNMFPKKMDEQYTKLMDMLSVIIARLDRMDELTEDIAAMARRHVHYGVRPAHYKLVGNALLWTLRQGLGQDWTIDVEQAWTKCYSNLADTMMRATELKKT